MLKKFLISTSFIIFSLSVYSSHILGGTMNYNYISASGQGVTYNLNIEIYRDCLNAQPAALAQDSLIIIGIYDKGTMKLFKTDTLKLGGLKRYSTCINNPNLCIDIGLYKKNIFLKNNDSGYVITYARCCRVNTFHNLSGQDNGLTLFTFIPPTSIHNSSADFYFIPEFINGVGKDNIDFGAYDLDGDSLVYTIGVPYTGGDKISPAPIPPASFVFPKSVAFYPNHSNTMPFGTNGSITIDSETGKINFKNTKEGTYLLTVELKEYRKGIIVGISRRDYPYVFISINPAIANNQKPKLNKPVIKGNLNVLLYWEMCPLNVSKYLLERKTDSTSWSVINTSTINEPYQEKVLAEIKYYYRVRAIVKVDTINSNVDSIFIGKTGLSNVFFNEVKIYPNPFNNVINFDLKENPRSLTIKIYSMTGTLVQQGLIESLNYSFNTSEIPNGLYTLEISSTDGYVYRKLMMKQAR